MTCHHPFSFSCWLMLVCTASAEIIPAERRITWDPGVRGGIPARTTIYTTLSTSATAAQIQSALNACPSNEVVKLAAGTFTINSTLTIPTGVTLRGSGLSNTILKGASGFSGSRFIYFNNNFDAALTQPARTLIAPTKDSTNLTTSAAHGWAVGDLVLIDMLNQPAGDPPVTNRGSLGALLSAGRENGNRPMGQLVEIKTVPTTDTATIDPPLYWSYNSTPEGVKMTGLTKYAGIEDLSIDNLTSSRSYIVALEGAVNCWLYNVELKGNYDRGLWGYNALWFTFQGCRVTGNVPIGTDKTPQYTSERAYGLFFGRHISASLVTDCIFEKLTTSIAFEGCASGNVFSYNFITNIWWRNDGASRRFGPLKHGPHPFMNLIEGNWSGGRIRADEYFGTSSHFVSLRNRVVQVDRGSPAQQNWTIDIERKNWYWSFVGNLLGGSGINESNYEYINGESLSYEGGPSTIWKIGYKSIGTGSDLYDVDTLNTILRWGNWSYRTNDSISGSGIRYHTNNVVDTGDTTIPDSYYLGGKPAWFGSLTWPPYDPATPTSNSPTNIPAGYRYVYGSGLAIAPQNLRVGNGQTIQFYATNSFGTGDFTNVTASAGWTSSIPGAVSINHTSGVAEVKTDGEFKPIISATWSNLTAATELLITNSTVYPPIPTRLLKLQSLSFLQHEIDLETSKPAVAVLQFSPLTNTGIILLSLTNSVVFTDTNYLWQIYYDFNPELENSNLRFILSDATGHTNTTQWYLGGGSQGVVSTNFIPPSTMFVGGLNVVN